MNEKKTRFIAIRNEALLDGKLRSIDKYLLMILERRKLLSTKNNNLYTVEIRSKKLKELSLISDGRTLIKSLDILRVNNYIDYSLDISKKNGKEILPKSCKIIITIDCSPPFVLVDGEMFDKISTLDTGSKKPYNIMVLYYFLEYNHNVYHGGFQGVSSPSRNEIHNIVMISGGDLTKYIKLMHNNMICEYFQGTFYDGNKKTRNRYLPNTIMHKQGEQFIGCNKRRYILHKKREYFLFDNSNVKDVDIDNSR